MENRPDRSLSQKAGVSSLERLCFHEYGKFDQKYVLLVETLTFSQTDDVAFGPLIT